jgi:hypothetical protein
MESERLQRYKEYSFDIDIANENDEKIADRIRKLLNDPRIDKRCLVDAYYYDFSVIPHEIHQKNNFCGDMYQIYGISENAEIISKWVERWDLDSDDEIVDGKVIIKEKSYIFGCIPEIKQKFNKDLLSLPTPSLNIFK